MTDLIRWSSESPAVAALEALGWWSVGAVWLPVLAWTVGAGLVLLALRRGSLAPRAEARVLAAALWSLPLGLALGAAAGAWLPSLGTLFGSSEPLPAEALADVLPAFGPAPAASEAAAPGGWAAWPWAAVAGGLLLGALALAAVRAAQYVRLRWQLARLPAVLGARADAEAQRVADALGRELGLGRPVRLLATPRAVPPMTYGWRRPTVVVPDHLFDDAEMLRLALLHELYHVRRRDYLWRSGERVLGCAFAAHPLVALLRRRLDAAREEACDAAVLERPGASAGRYAALIYRFLQPPAPVPAPLAVGMADARTIKRRLEAMKLPSRRTTQLSLLAALAVLTSGTFFVACSAMDPLNIDESDDLAAVAAGEDVFVVVEEMPVLEGGLQSIQQRLRYPQIAKDAGVEGRVIVQFVIDEEGRVTDPQVIKGVGSGLDEEALRVIRAATFTPGRQRGQAVPVKMSLPITFKLRGGSGSSLSALPDEALLFVDGREVRSVDHVDPSRIEHVEVLKGEQAVARYGERAADGVVLISTRGPQPIGQALQMRSQRFDYSGDRLEASGQITDASGDPVAGANIYVEGTPIGAVTGPDGRFSLSATLAEAGGTRPALRVSHVSYGSLLISGRNVLAPPPPPTSGARRVEEAEGTVRVAPPPPPALSASTTDEVFVIVDEMPTLPGGLRALQAQVQYPEVARRAGIEGRVIVQFIVDEEGRVTDPGVVKGLGAGLDEEAVRLVREATFTPGRQRGQAVPVKMSIPVTFKLP